jgi:UDP-N-acetyl-D-galactosamine dehydrogenase
MSPPGKISVLGLGYVGLPLAIALARHYPVMGFDIDADRVAEIAAGTDRTGEVTAEALAESNLAVSTREEDMAGSEVFIITVPTPVDDEQKPDLKAVLAACDVVGRWLGPSAVVVLESTVYPGLTEEVCGPRLEAASSLKCGEDFFLGYSPERINPGDREHTVERITKVVAGQTPEVTARLEALYGAITEGGVFIARDIMTAEAAKVIENAQRDINIAFVNEITMIFQRLGLSVYDVLEAAGTKWNFLDFTPGLVGGHCIGVDPFYLAHRAREVGHNPEIVLAGRRINDGMSGFIVDCVEQRVAPPARVLILGLTFKENVPDLRNSKVIDIITGLTTRGFEVAVFDPIADRAEASAAFGVDLAADLDALSGYDAVIGAVAHDLFRDFTAERFTTLLAPGGLVADVKGIWRHRELPSGIRRWQL